MSNRFLQNIENTTTTTWSKEKGLYFWVTIWKTNTCIYGYCNYISLTYCGKIRKKKKVMNTKKRDVAITTTSFYNTQTTYQNTNYIKCYVQDK